MKATEELIELACAGPIAAAKASNAELLANAYDICEEGGVLTVVAVAGMLALLKETILMLSEGTGQSVEEVVRSIIDRSIGRKG